MRLLWLLLLWLLLLRQVWNDRIFFHNVRAVFTRVSDLSAGPALSHCECLSYHLMMGGVLFQKCRGESLSMTVGLFLERGMLYL
jgi:hypothetical protein